MATGNADYRLQELERRVTQLESRGLGLFQANPEDPNAFVLPKSIGAELLKDGSVQSVHIADNAITAAKIATGAVGSDEIATGAVGSDEIAANAVDSSEIAADAVGASELAADAVGASELADLAVADENFATATARRLGIDTGSETLRQRDAVATSENTTSTVFAALTTPGPACTIDVPSANAVVGLWCRATMRGNGGATAAVDLQEDGSTLSGSNGVLSTASAAFELRMSSVDTTAGHTVQSQSTFTWFDTTAGSHTYRMVYKRTGGTSADFQTRRLFAICIEFV